jgi:hypothetical protein
MDRRGGPIAAGALGVYWRGRFWKIAGGQDPSLSEDQEVAISERSGQLVDAQIANAKEGLRQKWAEIATAKGTAAANAWYQRAEIGLKKEELKLKAEIERGTLGLSFLSEAAKLGGPGNYFQYLDYLSGARQISGLPNWLGALAQNAPQFAFNAPGPESMRPPAQSMNTLGQSLVQGAPAGAQQPGLTQQSIRQAAGDFGTTTTTLAPSLSSPYNTGVSVTTPSSGPQVISGSASGVGPTQMTPSEAQQPQRAAGTDPALAAALATVKATPPSNTSGYSPDDLRAMDIIGSIYATGGQAMGPQVYESLSPAQKALFQSSGRKQGFSPELFEQQITRSRFDQGETAAA